MQSANYAVNFFAGIVAAGLMVVVACSSVQAELTGEEVLQWVVDIKPEGIAVTGIVQNAQAADVNRWTADLIRNVEISVVKTAENLEFRYAAPVDQEVFLETQHPVLNGRQFCGFGQHLLVFPELKHRAFEQYVLTLNYPEDWTLVTSLGVNRRVIKVDRFEDLRGLMICAGDYAFEEFTLPNRTKASPTRYVLALHGERTFEDAVYFGKMKKVVEAQVAYFGGDHPAPVQAIALHILGKGIRPSIPGFNRRAPGHDSILGVHNNARPWGHFEFFGMLSHEHMHNWFPNVLQSDLGPWFMEGLNDYVAYSILFDNGLHTMEQYVGMLNKWYKEYLWCLSRDETPLMPYRRGMIAAWIMEVEIERATDNQKGLKNLLEHLLVNTPKNQRVTRDKFVAALQSLLGESAEDLYVRLIESAEPIPLAEYLKKSSYTMVQGKIRMEE